MEKGRNKKRKHRDGIWFNSTESIEYYAEEQAEKLQELIANIIFYVITIPMQLIQTVGVFTIAYFNNAFKELSFFLIGFFFTRTFLGETFHLHSTVGCTTVTWLLFFMITRFLPGINISVFLCVILGCGLAAYMNYMVVVKEDKKCQED